MENNTSISKSAIEVGINNSTAKVIIRKHKKNLQNRAKSLNDEKKILLN